jgi:hypothetical protein
MNDSKGRPRKKPPRSSYGKLLTAWGETKKSGAWMLDSRKHEEISISTLNARLLHGWSVEDALTKPLFNKPLSTQEKQKRREKRLEHQRKMEQNHRFAAMLLKLYEEGEHIDDLYEFFDIERYKLLAIVRRKMWYNPSVTPDDPPKDYIRQKRRIRPANLIQNERGTWVDPVYQIPWKDGYYYKYVYIPSKITGYISIRKCKTAIEAAKEINSIYEACGEQAFYKDIE